MWEGLWWAKCLPKSGQPEYDHQGTVMSAGRGRPEVVTPESLLLKMKKVLMPTFR